MSITEIIAISIAAISAVWMWYKTIYFPAKQKQLEEKEQHLRTTGSDRQEYEQEIGRLDWEIRAQDLATQRARQREINNQAIEIAKEYASEMMHFAREDMSKLQESVEELAGNSTKDTQRILNEIHSVRQTMLTIASAVNQLYEKH